MDTGFKVGPQKNSDGSSNVGRSGRTGEQMVADAHGRYLEAILRGNTFVACNVAAQALSAALTTTCTGLILSNPNGNTKAFSVLAAMFAVSVAEAAPAPQLLQAGFSTTDPTHTTPLAAPGIQSAIIRGGSANSSAKVDSAATTTGSPAYLFPLRSGFTAGALGGPGGAAWVDLGGFPLIMPGGWLAWAALTAVTGFAGFIWEEIDIS